MKTRIELKFAIVVAVIMVLVCLIVLTKQNSRKKELVDLKVYKYIEIDDKKGYVECMITTEELSKINKEMKKVNNLTDSTLLKGGIEGKYKVVVGDKFYAFDSAEDNVIFRGEDSEIHVFKGDTYQIVIDRCES